MIRRRQMRAPSLYFLLMASFLMFTASSAFLHPRTIHHATSNKLNIINPPPPSQKTTTRYHNPTPHPRQKIQQYLHSTPPNSPSPPLATTTLHEKYRRRRRKRDAIPLLLSTLAILLSPLRQPSHAVIGYIPRGARGLTDRDAPSRPREKIVPSDEYLQKLEEKGGRVKEMELKVLEADVGDGAPMKKREGEGDKQFGGLRPGVIAAVEEEEGDDRLSKEERLKRFQKYQAELRERGELSSAAAGGTSTTTTPPSSSVAPPSPGATPHKLGRVSSRAPPSKIKKRSGLVSATQFATLASAGVVWARWQNVEERKRVKKGIEIFESQKAEFFNVTSGASDEDLAKDLRDATKGGDDDDDDEDEDDEDEPPKKKAKKKPKKPSGGGGSGGSSPSAGGGAPKGGAPKGGVDRSEYSRASDDDIDRLKDLFKK